MSLKNSCNFIWLLIFIWYIYIHTLYIYIYIYICIYIYVYVKCQYIYFFSSPSPYFLGLPCRSHELWDSGDWPEKWCGCVEITKLDICSWFFNDIKYMDVDRFIDIHRWYWSLQWLLIILWEFLICMIWWPQMTCPWMIDVIAQQTHTGHSVNGNMLCVESFQVAELPSSYVPGWTPEWFSHLLWEMFWIGVWLVIKKLCVYIYIYTNVCGCISLSLYIYIHIYIYIII